MSITDLIPVLKGHGRRRAADKVEELRGDVEHLLTFKMAADDYFALLTQDRDEVYACWNDERRKRQEAEEIVVAQLVNLEDLRAENDQLHAELLALKAAAANANAVTVPPMVRDTTAFEDQATAPIPVMALREAAAAGRLGPVTNPGRTGPDDTQPIPAV